MLKMTEFMLNLMHFIGIFEVSPYRMPAARMELSHNILWNTTQVCIKTDQSFAFKMITWSLLLCSSSSSVI